MQDNNELAIALAAFKPQLAKAVEYRVYYDPDTGTVLNYTNDELPGSYISVDKETFAKHRFDCVIKDGKILPYRLPVGKLVPNDHGTACHPSDITLIVDRQAPHQSWKMKTYEQQD